MRSILKLLVFILATTVLITTALASPSGASTVNEVNSTSITSTGTAGNNSALAGNVTELTIYGDAVTQTWQGYYGNVSGAIRLGDAAGNIMYNWSLASPSGEVYASNASSVTWANVDCFNMSDSTAVSDLETGFGLTATSADGVDETFATEGNTEFFIGSTSFTTCNSVKTFNSSGVSVFEEVLLADGATPIFASLLLTDVNGFDSKTHDFQMLVLEDGHDGDTDTTPYYFWVELE